MTAGHDTPSPAGRDLVRAVVPRSVRNWVRSPRRTAAWLHGRLRFALGDIPEIELRPGWTVRCHPLAEQFAYGSQQSDAEQAAEFDCFIASCTTGMQLLDVGAHFGIFSLAALHYGGPDARAIAIDPSPTAASILRVQADLNGASTRVVVLTAAAGSTPGRLHMVDVGVLGAGYFVPDPGDRPDGDLTAVERRTLDEICGTFGFTPTHVKIDVEGAERDVLHGARALLSTRVAPTLFVELHNELVRFAGGDPRETIDRLRDHGYVLSGMDGRLLSDEEATRPAIVRCRAVKP